MSVLQTIDEHLYIRETVGYDIIKEVPLEDMPTVINFLKIVYNYNRMKNKIKEIEIEDKSHLLLRRKK
jgi:hypothetical protein